MSRSVRIPVDRRAAASGRGRYDVGSFAGGCQDTGLAARTHQGIRFLTARLQNTALRLVIAGSTYGMLGLGLLMRWLQGIDQRPHVGFRKLIARRLLGKAVVLFQFLLHLRQGGFYRQLLVLGLPDLLIELKQHFPDRHNVGFTTGSYILDMFDDLGGANRHRCRRRRHDLPAPGLSLVAGTYPGGVGRHGLNGHPPRRPGAFTTAERPLWCFGTFAHRTGPACVCPHADRSDFPC